MKDVVGSVVNRLSSHCGHNTYKDHTRVFNVIIKDVKYVIAECSEEFGVDIHEMSLPSEKVLLRSSEARTTNFGRRRSDWKLLGPSTDPGKDRANHLNLHPPLHIPNKPPSELHPVQLYNTFESP